MRKDRWTAEEDARLRAYVMQGLETKAIAEHFPNRTVFALVSRRSTLKCERPVPFSEKDPATVAQIVKFRMAGWRLQDISDVTGVAAPRLSMLQAKAGIRIKPACRIKPKHKARWTALENVRLRRLLRKRVPLAKIWEQYPNRSLEAMRNRVYQLTKYWGSPEARRERFENQRLWRKGEGYKVLDANIRKGL